MVLIRDVNTQEVHKVNNTRVNGGEIVSKWDAAMPKIGGSFERSNPWLVRTDRTQWDAAHQKACQVWELADGYELVTGRTRGDGVRVPKGETKKDGEEIPNPTPDKDAAPEATPTPETTPETKEGDKKDGEGEETPTPTPEDEEKKDEDKPKKERKTKTKKDEEEKPKEDNADEVAKRIAEALRELNGEKDKDAPQVDEDKIREIAREVAEEVVEEKGAKRDVIEVKMPERPKVEIEGVVCDDFKDMLEDLQDGYFPYMYGAAGCGKSHTAEQLAKAMGLTFYSQTTIQFAHDVRGYGDAGGNFVDTPFYKAFAHGGLYFQDEFDRSMPEASIVLNTALANGYYDFPVVGRVFAHEDFHFIAAGNTRMKGADEDYVTGQVQDASSRDRLVEYEMKYDRRIEIGIALNDDELVDFVEDVRSAIKEANIQHIVSYRATKYMAEKKSQRSLEKILKRKTFAGLDADEIRVLYGCLANPENKWAKAMKKLF